MLAEDCGAWRNAALLRGPDSIFRQNHSRVGTRELRQTTRLRIVDVSSSESEGFVVFVQGNTRKSVAALEGCCTKQKSKSIDNVEIEK